MVIFKCDRHLPTYFITYLPTYLLSYLPSYLPTYLPNYLPTYLPCIYSVHQVIISPRKAVIVMQDSIPLHILNSSSPISITPIYDKKDGFPYIINQVLLLLFKNHWILETRIWNI